MLVGQMLKQMQSSMFGDEDTDSGFAQGPLGDAMYSELSLALTRSGGLGLAESMLGSLVRQADQSGGEPTAIMSPTGPLALTPPTLALDRATPAFTMASPMRANAVTSAFGWRQDPFTGGSKFHRGTDIAMPVGQEVPVAQAGRVVFAGEQGSYGLTVLVEHAGGFSTRYAHLSQATVAAGDQVVAGQTIAKSGVSGRSTGPHLHFEVLEDGRSVDPSAGLARLGTAVQLSD